MSSPVEHESCSNTTIFQPDSCLTPFPQAPYPLFSQPQKLRPIRRTSDDMTQQPCLVNEARCDTASFVSKAFQDYKAQSDAQLLDFISQATSFDAQFRCLLLNFLPNLPSFFMNSIIFFYLINYNVHLNPIEFI